MKLFLFLRQTPTKCKQAFTGIELLRLLKWALMSFAIMKDTFGEVWADLI